MSGRPNTNGDVRAADVAGTTGEIVLEARSVTKIYPAPGGGTVHALADVSLRVERGRTLGLVGESGSGKTTMTRMLLALERPTSGELLFEGSMLSGLSPAAVRNYRHAVAAVFQNPYSSLDPRMRIWDAVTEQQAIEKTADKRARRAHAEELLELVGLGAAMATRYPHQLSGGQRQRVAIARALASNPEVIVLDEPLSALDVSVSAQIVNLLLDVQERLGVTYVFVGHDLRLVKHLCHDVAVMYRGRIVEQGPAVAILERPTHPYTSGARDGIGAHLPRRHRRRRHQGASSGRLGRVPVPNPVPDPRQPLRHGDAGHRGAR